MKKSFDVEQFLSLTMVLAAAGAVGVGIYSNRADEPEAAPQPTVAQVEEAFPEAEPDEPEASAPMAPAPTAATLTPMPALDAAPEVLDEAPGPQVESMSW